MEAFHGDRDDPQEIFLYFEGDRSFTYVTRSCRRPSVIITRTSNLIPLVEDYWSYCKGNKGEKRLPL